MRKRIAVLLALAIGFAYDPSGIAAMAAGNPDKNAEAEASIEKAAESEENQEKVIEAEERKEKNKETEEEKEKTAETEERKEQSAEKEKLPNSEEDVAEKTEEDDSFLNKLLGNFFGKEEEKEVSDKSNKKMQKAADKKTAPQETSALKNLQIPQKLDVVIDPWEIDKKGQVYSEQYTISNTGDIPGILTLSNLACRPREKSGVIIRTDKEGLHDSGDKAIYMEMLFGNGEQIIFSQENSQYQKELMPGEELSIRFVGEVNENAFGKWENNDIAVSVVYSWEMEESADAGAENPEENITDDTGETGEDARPGSERDSEEIPNDETTEVSEKTDLNPEESGKDPETDTETGESEGQQTGTGADETDKKPEADGNETQEPPLDANEVQQSPSDASQVQESLPDTNTGVGTEQPETLSNTENSSLMGNLAAGMQESQTGENNPGYSEHEKEEIKNIDLLEPQKVDVLIDSWKTNEKGQIVSSEYLLYNTGDTTGIWTLSELACEPQEQSGVAIRKDKNELRNGEGKSVYMELILGNGEKVILSQEKSQYKVELKPGEKLSVRFVGETNGNLLETREDGEIAVRAVCSWNLI